jgi:hypothetical protein
LFARGRWFSPGTSASSTTKTGRHDIVEILLKVALNTKNQTKIKPNNRVESEAVKSPAQMFFFTSVVAYCVYKMKKKTYHTRNISKIQ